MKLLILMALFGIFAAKREVGVIEGPALVPVPEIAEDAVAPQFEKKELPKAKVGE